MRHERARQARTYRSSVREEQGRRTRLLMETAISGADQAVPAEQRDYVQRVRAAATASEKIHVYATAVTEANSRLAPLHLLVRERGWPPGRLAAWLAGTWCRLFLAAPSA